MKINSILLIEDDELTASLYNLLLTDLNVSEELIIKTEPEDGLSFLVEACKNQNCPDIIFVDIKMPGLSGFELIEEINKLKTANTFNGKIIVLTSSSFIKDIEKAKDLNVDDYLFKPLNKEKVNMVLEKYFS